MRCATGAPKGERVLNFWSPFGAILGAIFYKTSKKWHPKVHPKIDAEKVLKNDAKRIQNEAKIDAEIIVFSYFFEKGENARNYLFYNIKRGSGHLKMLENCARIQSNIDVGKMHAYGRRASPPHPKT